MKTYRNLMARTLALVLTCLPALALAGTSSLVVKDGNGSSQTLSQITDAANSSYLGGVCAVTDAVAGYKATVKNASTAAAAGDYAEVIALSPNGGVGGWAAVGATAANNPVWAGGTYNTSPTTLSNGQVGGLQLDTNENLYVRQAPTGLNPCMNPNVTLSSVTGNTSGTSATQIIALSGTTKIYICGISVVGISGTNPLFSLVQGTGSNCASSQSPIFGGTGVPTTAGTPIAASNIAVTSAGYAVCYLDGGTTPVQAYTISYVQQ